MKNVCVITGGGSGMGLAAAKFMPKEKIIVISGRTVAKLENAVNELKELGYEAYAFACDTSDRESVKKLAEYALSIKDETLLKPRIGCIRQEVYFKAENTILLLAAKIGLLDAKEHRMADGSGFAMKSVK